MSSGARGASASTARSVRPHGPLPVEIADNDQAGLVLSPTSLALTEGGPAATVNVGISSTPKNGAVVNLTATTSGLCTVSPASLADIQYNAPRTLTVTPGRDHVPGGRDCTVHLATTSPQRYSPPPLILPLPRDPDYDGLTADIGGPVTNVDIPGVTVTPTDLALDTTAANPTATYQVVLDTMPTDDVTITPTTSDPAVTVSGPVTFTPDNWDQPQTVTLTAPAGTAPHTAVINLEVTAGDAAYLALDLGDVNVAVGDPATTITLTPNPDQPTTTKPTSVTATLTADVGTPTGTHRCSASTDSLPATPGSPTATPPSSTASPTTTSAGSPPVPTPSPPPTPVTPPTTRPPPPSNSKSPRSPPNPSTTPSPSPRTPAPPPSTCSPTTPTPTPYRSTDNTEAANGVVPCD